MKYLWLIVLLFAMYGYWQHCSLQKIRQDNEMLRQQNVILKQKQDNFIRQVENFNDKQQKANEHIAKLKKQAMQQNDDCYNRIMDASFAEFVRGKH